MRDRMLLNKLTAAMLALLVVFTLTACGQSQPDVIVGNVGGTSGTNGTTTPSGDTTDPSVEPTYPEPIPTEPETETTEEYTEPSTEESNGLTGYEYEITPLIGAVPAGDRVDKSYFDDAVFVGDSVSMKLNFYCAASGALGNAQFLTAGSLGSANALWEVSNNSVHPVYNGQKQLIEKSIASMDVNKVYIMLGMNDIAIYGLDGAVNNMVKLIERILVNSPDVQIVVQSMTPMTSTSNLLSSSGHNPQNIHTYNMKLMNMCNEKGYYFLDVASVMYNDNGFLRREYCSDPDGMGIHFTNAGCVAWVDYLLTHPIQ